MKKIILLLIFSLTFLIGKTMNFPKEHIFFFAHNLKNVNIVENKTGKEIKFLKIDKGQKIDSDLDKDKAYKGEQEDYYLPANKEYLITADGLKKYMSMIAINIPHSNKKDEYISYDLSSNFKESIKFVIGRNINYKGKEIPGILKKKTKDFFVENRRMLINNYIEILYGYEDRFEYKNGIDYEIYNLDTGEKVKLYKLSNNKMINDNENYFRFRYIYLNKKYKYKFKTKIKNYKKLNISIKINYPKNHRRNIDIMSYDLKKLPLQLKGETEVSFEIYNEILFSNLNFTVGDNLILPKNFSYVSMENINSIKEGTELKYKKDIKKIKKAIKKRKREEADKIKRIRKRSKERRIAALENKKRIEKEKKRTKRINRINEDRKKPNFVLGYGYNNIEDREKKLEAKNFYSGEHIKLSATTIGVKVFNIDLNKPVELIKLGKNELPIDLDKAYVNNDTSNYMEKEIYLPSKYNYKVDFKTKRDDKGEVYFRIYTNILRPDNIRTRLYSPYKNFKKEYKGKGSPSISYKIGKDIKEYILIREDGEAFKETDISHKKEPLPGTKWLSSTFEKGILNLKWTNPNNKYFKEVIIAKKKKGSFIYDIFEEDILYRGKGNNFKYSDFGKDAYDKGSIVRKNKNYYYIYTVLKGDIISSISRFSLDGHEQKVYENINKPDYIVNRFYMDNNYNPLLINHINISLVGGKYVKIINLDNNKEVKFTEPTRGMRKPDPDAAYHIGKNNSFSNKVFLPAKNKYIVQIKKRDGMPFLHAFVTIPDKKEWTRKLLNYENVFTEKEDNKLASFIVGVNNKNFIMKREDKKDFNKPYNKDFFLSFLALENIKVNKVEEGYKISWTIPKGVKIKDIVAVKRNRKRPSNNIYKEDVIYKSGSNNFMIVDDYNKYTYYMIYNKENAIEFYVR